MEEQPNNIIQYLKDGKQLHDKFAEQFQNLYKVSGKLISDWKDYFTINIPPDMNTQLCQAKGAQIIHLHQEATFMKAAAEAKLSAIKDVNAHKYRTKFTSLVAEFKTTGQKIPAKDTLATLTEQSMSELSKTVVHAEIELAFWKDILSDLANSRKVIENITISLATEAKALQNERYIDTLNKKNNEYYGA